MSGTRVNPDNLELLKFAYAEVLDATKHQDDKVGRLLGAVAFLTGAALIFARSETLQVGFRFDGRDIPIVAVSLGVFVLLDLVAVILFLTATSAPLTLPRRVGNRRSERSHIYFTPIARTRLEEWLSDWSKPTGDVTAKISDELAHEIRNIALRTERKYRRSSIATNIFIAALVAFAPVVVLGLDVGVNTVTSPDTNLIEAITLTNGRRILIGASLSLVVAVVLFSAWQRTRLWADDTWIQVAALAMSYSAFLFMAPIANSRNVSFWMSGSPAVIAFGSFAGILQAWLLWPAATTEGDEDAAGSSFGAIISGSAIVALAIGVAISAEVSRPDIQFMLAIAAGCSVVVPSILKDIGEIAGTFRTT